MQSYTVRSGGFAPAGVPVQSAGIRTGAISSRGTVPVTTMPATYSAAATRAPAATYSAAPRSVAYTPQATTRVAQPVAAATTATRGTYTTSNIISGTRTIGAPATTYAGATSYAAPATTYAGATTYAAAPATRVVGQPQVISGGVLPTSFISAPVTATSANLMAAGPIVSERVIPVEAAYEAGMVRAEAQPQVVMMQGNTMVMQEGPVTVVAEDMTGDGQPNVITQGVDLTGDGQPNLVVTQIDATGDGQVNAEMVMMDTNGDGQLDTMAVAQAPPGPPRVLIVCTSANQLGEVPTGAWSEEITGPYYVFSEAGCEVYIASIMGGPVPVDQNSLAEGTATQNDQRFYNEGGNALLDQSLALNTINIEDVDCVWLAGGHGTCLDFEANLAQFVTDAVAFGRPVGAVCHGVIGLLSAINSDSTPLLAGRQVTGFSNAEEDAVGLSQMVPFLVENRMKEVGAQYSCADAWQEYALSDGQIITGQNPQSSILAAQLCVQAMMPPQPQ